MGRSGLERLDAIPAVIAAGEEFRARLAEAEGDAVRCADLMAEAIDIARSSRMFEAVGRDGRVMFSMEALEAAHCLDAARAAYARARGTNASIAA
jgi:hypothetical protein